MMLLRTLLPPALLLGCAARSGIEDSRARIQALEWENAELREQVGKLEVRLRSIYEDMAKPPKTGAVVTICDSPPPLTGTVLEVDRQHGWVVLDKGQRDGVEVGYCFGVYLGAQFKGMVRIAEVQESTSLALVLAEKTEIAAGDFATTTLY